MTVLVTGASGHVGANLVRALLDDGRKVRVTVREDTRGIDSLDVERVTADTRQGDTLRAAMDGVEVVYNCAARISIVGPEGGLVHDTNVVGTGNVVESCLDAGVKRLVHFSSIHAIRQGNPGEAIVEANGLACEDGRKMPAYDRSKGEGEHQVYAGIEKGLDAVVVSPAAVLGRNDFKPSRMGHVLLDLYHRKMPALIEGGFNWVDVRDVVAGAIAAETKGRTGERYLLAGHYATVRELADIVTEVTGVKTPGFVCPQWLARVGAPFVETWSKLSKSEPLYTAESLAALRWNPLLSTAKAEEELGYNSRPLRETIEDAYAWFREAGMLAGSTATPTKASGEKAA